MQHIHWEYSKTASPSPCDLNWSTWHDVLMRSLTIYMGVSYREALWASACMYICMCLLCMKTFMRQVFVDQHASLLQFILGRCIQLWCHHVWIVPQVYHDFCNLNGRHWTGNRNIRTESVWRMEVGTWCSGLDLQVELKWRNCTRSGLCFPSTWPLHHMYAEVLNVCRCDVVLMMICYSIITFPVSVD